MSPATLAPLPEKRHAPKADPWRLDRRLADNAFLLSVSILLNAALLCVLCIQPILVANAASRTVQVAVIDPHGSIYSTQTERLLDSTALLKLTAESFVLAGYSKDPAGLRYSDMLHAIASEPVALAFEKHWSNSEAADFGQRQIHQNPEIGQIRVISRGDEQVIVSVDGQLVRSGVVQGAQFTEALPFKIILTLKLSISHTKSLNYPLQVVGTDVTIGGRKI